MDGLGPGLGLEEVAGDEESLEGGRDDVVEEGVAGRPVVFVEVEGTGDLRERNGEMEERFDLLDIFQENRKRIKVNGNSKFIDRVENKEGNAGGESERNDGAAL